MRNDKKNLDHAGGEISQTKEDNFKQQTAMLLQNKHEMENQLERGKEPVHGKLMEKSKQSELQKNSEASNSENRQETIFTEMDNDRTLAKSYNAPVSNDKSYKSDYQEVDHDDNKPSTSNQMEGNTEFYLRNASSHLILHHPEILS